MCFLRAARPHREAVAQTIAAFACEELPGQSGRHHVNTLIDTSSTQCTQLYLRVALQRIRDLQPAEIVVLSAEFNGPDNNVTRGDASGRIGRMDGHAFVQKQGKAVRGKPYLI
jgi:hypothetical protein